MHILATCTSTCKLSVRTDSCCLVAAHSLHLNHSQCRKLFNGIFPHSFTILVVSLPLHNSISTFHLQYSSGYYLPFFQQKEEEIPICKEVHLHAQLLSHVFAQLSQCSFLCPSVHDTKRNCKFKGLNTKQCLSENMHNPKTNFNMINVYTWQMKPYCIISVLLV